MAVVLIGGLVTSTLLTPILLPVVYTLIEDLRATRARRRREAPEYGGYAR
jgi:HAE1 family hydrophobic/amphiphilic exporter-1